MPSPHSIAICLAVLLAPLAAPPAGGEPLGERVFALRRPPSAFPVAGSGEENADLSRGDWSADPLRLVAGAPDIDGIAPLALAEDAVIAVPLDGGILVCFGLRAAASDGFVDCDGGTPVDAFFSQQASPGGPLGTIDYALGEAPGGAGAALLHLDFAVAVTTASDCAAVDLGGLPSSRGLLTTGRLVSTVRDSRQGGDVTLAVRGRGLSCVAWGESSAGIFVGLPGNLFAVATPSGSLDLAGALLLAAAPLPCAGDCDGSGAIDAADLARIAALFVSCPPCAGGAAALGCDAVPAAGDHCPAADDDGDGCISAAEFTKVVAAAMDDPICP